MDATRTERLCFSRPIGTTDFYFRETQLINGCERGLHHANGDFVPVSIVNELSLEDRSAETYQRTDHAGWYPMQACSRFRSIQS